MRQLGQIWARIGAKIGDQRDVKDAECGIQDDRPAVSPMSQREAGRKRTDQPRASCPGLFVGRRNRYGRSMDRRSEEGRTMDDVAIIDADAHVETDIPHSELGDSAVNQLE